MMMMNAVRLASLESITNLPQNVIDEESNIALKMRKYLAATSENSQIFGILSGSSRRFESILPDEPCLSEERRRYRTYSHHGKIEGMGSPRRGNNSKTPIVMVIDDNPLNLVIAKHLISAYKRFIVKTELYAQTAIEYVKNNDFDVSPIALILIDCQMPEMDGYQATRVLRDLMRLGKIPEIPIVALTANNNESDKKACLKAGMSEYLSKPLTDNDLMSLFKKYGN